MKKIIIKLTTVFTLLFVSIFMISFTKADAASSRYSLATYFTFSSDMNKDEGFDLIKPYVLYEDGNPVLKDYTFTATPEGNNRYHLTGNYPDGSRFSITTTVLEINNASGTYVEAQMINPYRQSIYIKSLNEGKTSNDCLMECWKNKWVNIVYPTYNLLDNPNKNIYNHLTTFSNAAGTYQLQYYAVIENVNVAPPATEDTNDGTNNDNQNNDLPEIVLPSGGDEPSTGNNSNNNSNNNSGSSNNNSTGEKENTKDPVLIALYCIGIILGIVLIFIIYKVVRLVIKWLKR